MAINYDLSDLNLIGAYIQEGEEYKQTNEIPTSGYEFNSEESYCIVNGENINATINFDIESQTLSVVPLTQKGTKCYLYFDEKASGSEYILLHYDTILTRNDFSTVITDTTTGTIYKSANESQFDDFGEVYYFVGNPTDNWVNFAGFYWRIIRINGNGSIRLIYNGATTVQTGNNTMISTNQKFNNLSDDNIYVGLKYATGQVHGTEKSSLILNTLNGWYANNLTNVAMYLDGNVGFCGDRYPSTDLNNSNGLGGVGTTETYYGAYVRLAYIKNPIFKCIDTQDLYTTIGSDKGNKSLSNPIGLISADEAVFAGGIFGVINNGYYLYNNADYWTLSPLRFTSMYHSAYMAIIGSAGFVSNERVTSAYGVRPVINIRSDVAITGTGTTTDPYKIVS